VRLILASFFYPPSIGGVERHTSLLAHGLGERGHSVRVVAARFGAAPVWEQTTRLSVYRAGRAEQRPVLPTLQYVASLLRIMHQMRGCTDVVHVQQALYPAVASAMYTSFAGQPLVVANHGSGHSGGMRVMQRSPFGSLGIRLIARVATGVALSEEMRDEMRAAGFRSVAKIPNGVPIPEDLTTERRAAARQLLGISGRVVLYIGRLQHEKGVDVLAEAWRSLSIPDATLLAVGDGPLREVLARLQTNGTMSRVDLRGPTGDVQTYLDAADVFVLPSRAEGLSYALLEAMATGVPVVATSVGGNREVVASPDLGVLVPSEDAPALAAALAEVIDNRELASRLGRSGREHVRSSYSVQTMLDAYERLYCSIERRRH
jgi:glycosyltransferase involved in cell wall biosynthesis